MRAVFCGALFFVAACGPASAQVEPEVGAVGIAQSSGRVIAGALICGVAKDRALVVGRRAVERAHEIAPNVPAQQLAQYHAEALASATRAYGQINKAQCRTALNSYRQIEDMLTVRR